jgi:hypothetical protein
MARSPESGGSGKRLRRSGSAAKRAWPVVLMAWERWQKLPEEDKERYRARARDYAQRGRQAVDEARRRRGR